MPGFEIEQALASLFVPQAADERRRPAGRAQIVKRSPSISSDIPHSRDAAAGSIAQDRTPVKVGSSSGLRSATLQSSQ